MKRAYLLLGMTLAFFLLEFVIANFLGRWLKPNLLILLVIFVDLHLGSRWGIYTALMAGILRDSFTTGVFGVHIFAFVFCVYVITLIRKYLLFDTEFGFLRILMALVMSILNVSVVYILLSLFKTIDFRQMMAFVMLPEVVMTTLVASIVFKELKKCVLKLSV